MTVKSPQPISGTSLRMRMMRSVQFSSDSGWRRWMAALTCSYPYGPPLITGLYGLSPLVAVEHRGEAAADAAIVELHGGIRREGGEHRLPLLFGQAAEIELIMIA